MVGELCMIRGRDKYCFKSLQKCYRHAIFYINRQNGSKVITKHLCNDRNSFYKSFYRVILTTVFLRNFRSEN